MFSRFFIDRPIAASVIALLMVFAGSIAIPLLQVELYPEIVPPRVSVTASYPGASAQTMVDAVTVPLEDEINGVRGMVSVESTSTDQGQVTIVVTFEVGYDLDIAAVDVQNRVELAKPRLPDEVIKNGIDIEKGSTDIVMFVHVISPGGKRDLEYIANYAAINVVDPIKRVKGVGEVVVFGDRTYAMRIWVDPVKLAGYRLTVNDVISAVRDQNEIAPVGIIGGTPSKADQSIQLIVETKGRLDQVEEFEDIVVSRSDNGSLIFVKDIARVELGADDYLTDLSVNSHPAVGIGISQLPNANTLEVVGNIKTILNALEPNLPEGITYDIARDATLFINGALKEVGLTFLFALVLIVLVAYVFLQNWRTTLITLITIPVSLIGTFAFLALLGFSMNMLSLFGLILAIGLVVDDAVVVIENINRIKEQESLPVRDATIRAMDEVRGPIIASTLVMMSVFIPAAFMPGITGKLYQQFAITVSCSLALSLVNALTFTPALCALLLKSHDTQQGWFFRKFNAAFDALLVGYDKLLKWTIPRKLLMTSVFLLLVGATTALIFLVPRGFLPEEDQGFFYVNVQLPEGSSLKQTHKAMQKVLHEAQKLPGVMDVVLVDGFSILSHSKTSNSGFVVIEMLPFDQRDASESVFKLTKDLQLSLDKIGDAQFLVINVPAVQGLSTAGGFEYILEDRAAQGLEALYSNTQLMLNAANAQPAIRDVFSPFKIDTPILYLDIDRAQVMRQGVLLQDLYLALQANLGSFYINDFNKYGKIYRVFIQADIDFRSSPEDLQKIYVKNINDDLVPISDLVRYEYRAGASKIRRYNLYTSAHLIGSPSTGHTSGEAIAIMEQLTKEILTDGFFFEWTDTAYQAKKAGNVAPIVFALSIIIILMILAILYESWLLPFMIILAVPFAVLGALSFQFIRGLANDTFCQIALIMLVGLSAKNAILIVQFANEKYVEGSSVVDSVIFACNTRLRPILMTAIAFVAGIFPLVIATGAGAASRHSLGTAVFGGMIVSTTLALIFVPSIYVIFQRFREKRVPDLRARMQKQRKTPSNE
ncbi:Efflux pump membrane transporter BepE [BD1-7 clade bacterium]|uniref:Efflux pump membrane transporter n=1 Tax=BD1-7 clade bacterium TaxID=2029982 RepID=A0A5S9PYW6_9GAMM|nr:Efflux pump membrane transporter BepE [BD1-7 clade bacterium]CAA0109690.1 Efflux pump membrane transporter BepE [BD1-7 clade bacterium]